MQKQKLNPISKSQIPSHSQASRLSIHARLFGFKSFGAYWVARFAGLGLGIWNFHFRRSLRTLQLIFFILGGRRDLSNISRN